MAMTGLIGARIYLVPEIFRNGSYISKSDIYALVVTVLEYLEGLPLNCEPGTEA